MRIQYTNMTGTATRTLASHPHVSVTRAPRVGGGQSMNVTESYKVHTRALPRVRTNLSLCRCRTANGEAREICANWSLRERSGCCHLSGNVVPLY